MAQTTARPEDVDSIHLANATPAALDSLPLERLFRAVTAEEAGDGRGKLSQQALDKLDKVYQVKVVRLLASAQENHVEVMRLDDHLGRVACDADVHTLNAGVKPYAVRWRFLRELLATALAIREVQSEVAEEAPENVRKEAWELVARRVLQGQPEGVPWKAVAEEVRHLPSVARSKASLSVLLSHLATAGWVEARSVGREKYLRPGPRITASVAFRELIGGATNSERFGLSGHPAALENSPSGRAVALLREYVCFSQGRLIEHFHLINSKHKAIRLSARSKGANTTRVAATKLAVERFMGYLNEEFEFVAKATFNKLAQHFERRGTSGTRVRVCLKGNWTQGGTSVVDILRDSDVGYHSEPTDVQANAGFKEVSASGTYFLANNLPDMSLKGQYWNPRIDPKKVARMRERLREKHPNGELQMNHEQWIGCWTDGGLATDTSKFYRSTLIIPCTVWNNSLSDTFLRSIRRQVPEMDASFDRIILGYLCLDHVDTNFFEQPLDVDVGYVMADMLSIFLFARWLLTEASDTYKDALKLINSVESELRLYAPQIRRHSEIPSGTLRTRTYPIPADRLLVGLTGHKRHSEDEEIVEAV